MAEKPSFPLQFWRDLGASCVQGPIEPEIVESWFDINYPKMTTYGYRNWRRAIASWWLRATADDIEAADHRLERIAATAEDIRLHLLAKDANSVAKDDAYAVYERGRFVVHRGGRSDG